MSVRDFVAQATGGSIDTLATTTERMALNIQVHFGLGRQQLSPIGVDDPEIGGSPQAPLLPPLC
jgi:hypothetical protein